jgi:hypothetical protein
MGSRAVTVESLGRCRAVIGQSPGLCPNLAEMAAPIRIGMGERRRAAAVVRGIDLVAAEMPHTVSSAAL